MKTRRPAWWVLYLLLPLAAALLVAVSAWIPTSAGRTFAEAAVSLAILGGMALWVRANRITLALRDTPENKEALFRAWIAYQPPVRRCRQSGALASESQRQMAA